MSIICPKTSILIILLLTGLFARAQTQRIDSLKKDLAGTADPGKKLNTLLALCDEKTSLNPDTLLKYASAAKEIALQHGDSNWIVLSNYYIAYNLVTRSLSDSGLAIIDRQLAKLDKRSPNKTYIDFLLLKARAFNNTGKTKECLDMLYPLLATAERSDDTLTQLNVINLILGAYVNLGQDYKALEWGNKALPLFPSSPTMVMTRVTSVILGNISLCYLHLYESEKKTNWLDSAKKYITPSVVEARQYQLVGVLAYNLGLSGTILGFDRKLPEGEAMLKESLKIYREIGNTFHIINAMSVMANFYGFTAQPAKGIAISKEALELSKNTPPNIYLYSNLAENYRLAARPN